MASTGELSQDTGAWRWRIAGGLAAVAVLSACSAQPTMPSPERPVGHDTAMPPACSPQAGDGNYGPLTALSVTSDSTKALLGQYGMERQESEWQAQTDTVAAVIARSPELSAPGASPEVAFRVGYSQGEPLDTAEAEGATDSLTTELSTRLELPAATPFADAYDDAQDWIGTVYIVPRGPSSEAIDCSRL